MLPLVSSGRFHLSLPWNAPTGPGPGPLVPPVQSSPVFLVAPSSLLITCPWHVSSVLKGGESSRPSPVFPGALCPGCSWRVSLGLREPPARLAPPGLSIHCVLQLYKGSRVSPLRLGRGAGEGAGEFA